MTTGVPIQPVLGDFIPSSLHWGLRHQKVSVLAPYLRAALAVCGARGDIYGINRFLDDISEEEKMEQSKIEADTSKYINTRDRVLAAAECIKAQRAGKLVEIRDRGDAGGSWRFAGYTWDCNGLDFLDYRVKPAPFVHTEVRYRIRANICLLGTQQEYLTRREALDALGSFCGPCAVDKVVVTLHDGEEVSREVTEAVG